MDSWTVVFYVLFVGFFILFYVFIYFFYFFLFFFIYLFIYFFFCLKTKKILVSRQRKESIEYFSRLNNTGK